MSLRPVLLFLLACCCFCACSGGEELTITGGGGIRKIPSGLYGPYVNSARWIYQSTTITCGDVAPDTTCSVRMDTELLTVQGDTIVDGLPYVRVNERLYRVDSNRYTQLFFGKQYQNSRYVRTFLNTSPEVGNSWQDTIFWDQSVTAAPVSRTVHKYELQPLIESMTVADITYRDVLEVQVVTINRVDGQAVQGSPRSYFYAPNVGEILLQEPRFNGSYRRELIDFQR